MWQINASLLKTSMLRYMEGSMLIRFFGRRIRYRGRYYGYGDVLDVLDAVGRTFDDTNLSETATSHVQLSVGVEFARAEMRYVTPPRSPERPPSSTG